MNSGEQILAGESAREPTSNKTTPIDGKLLKEAATLPALLLRRSRLEDAIAALKSNLPPTILPLAKHVAPRRDPSCTIKPVESLDELIALVSSVIEGITKSKAGRLASQLTQLHQTPLFQQSMNEVMLLKTLERAKRWNEIAPEYESQIIHAN